MLVTALDLQSPITRAMFAVLGYLNAPFQIVPTHHKIPEGCIELTGPEIFIAGVLTPDSSDIPTIEEIVRASKHDCILVRLDKTLDGSPMWIDVIQYGIGPLHYHGGLDLYQRRGQHALFIDTRRSVPARPHGLRVTPFGLMPTGELPRLSDIEDLRGTNDHIRYFIWSTRSTAPLVDRPDGK